MAYGIDNVVGQHMFLNDPGATFWPSLIFVLSTQLTGYGLSGLTRRFLVYPSAMLWPSNLASIALFKAYHPDEHDDEEQLKETQLKSKGLSRFAFFWIVTCAMFVYEFLPQYIMSTLQLISLLCFFSSSQWASTLGSGNIFEGFGVLSFSLDWSIITSWTSPLTTPFWAVLNLCGGWILWLWILGPIFQFTNPFGIPTSESESGFNFRDGTPFPSMNTPHLFDNQGNVQKPKSFITFPDLLLNQPFYDEHKPITISNSFALAYFTSFVNIACCLTHVYLWYGKDIWRQTKEAFNQMSSREVDIHCELMKAYPDLTELHYLIYAVVMLVAQIFVLQFTSFQLPWWGTILAYVMAVVFMIPIGAIQALTNNQIGLNVITEFVIGLILPGQIVPVMTFKSFG